MISYILKNITPIILLTSAQLIFIHIKLKRTLAKEKRTGTRSPFSEKLLRPPGESLRFRIEETQERINDTFLNISIITIAPAFVYISIASTNQPLAYISSFVTLAISVYLINREWKKFLNARKDLRNYRLGFDAERVVASELQALLSSGYQVFHDLVFDSSSTKEKDLWNIDHLAVGKNGVFVFETKGKRKQTSAQNSPLKGHELKYDGQQITFPNGFTTSKPLKQARKNAEHVKKWLSKCVKTDLPCYPIVVYPGWFIKAANRDIFEVQAVKGITKRIEAIRSTQQLSEAEIRSISALLEEKCRNVECAN